MSRNTSKLLYVEAQKEESNEKVITDHKNERERSFSDIDYFLFFSFIELHQ